MLDFDFTRFGTRSFERFSQALAARFVAPGIRVYGDGADGAREASFQGQMNYPSVAQGWDGYLVAQAKFRQVPGSPDDDASWLVNAMSDELDKFLDDDLGLKKPEYYLLITNARLSPLPKGKKRAGGIAKLDDLFERYRSKLGLKEYAIWHYDELCARLVDAEEIRRAHAAWITPSDVLAEVMAGLTFERRDFGAIMNRFLQNEVRAQRTTRLQQAGHGGDTATNLEDVFVDLPFVEHTPPEESEAGELLLANLLRRCRQRLTPSAISREARSGPRPDRLLLLGGPGQGKSTVSQLFAQLLRASLLKTETTRPISADTAKAVNSILARTAAQGLADDMPRRFPVRIELPFFADALTAAAEMKEKLPLIEFVRRHIADAAREPALSLSDLRTWLGAYPFVFLLDGLDEVPPSANRGDVITAINDFWDDLSSVDADVLMLVTTRPQGYNDDLDPALYGKVEMSKLEKSHALGYATKLAEVLLPEPQHRARVLKQMGDASETPTTARLLVSPLQVAIMLALIDRRGEAPSDRWTLFDRYFNVVLEREQQKPNDAGRMVKKWSRVIGALHQTIGFALHLRAETRGGSDAHLTRAELEQLVEQQLANDGFKGAKLEEGARELLEATTDRLVLLVERIDERYSFEVRSLQEFKAAAFLMAGPEAIVQTRLREIANKSHWRHVFQIAASKCFSENDALHYRDTIVSICRELDFNNPPDAALKSGARLALSLLEDELAFDAPNWRNNLFLNALEIIHVGAAPALPAILRMIEEAPEAAETFLRPHLVSAVRTTQIGAWRIVTAAAVAGNAWASELVVEAWPASVGDQLEVIACSPQPAQGTTLWRLFNDTLSNAPPLEIIEKLNDGERERPLNAMASRFPYLRALNGSLDQYRQSVRLIRARKETPMSLKIMPIAWSEKLAPTFDSLPDSLPWRPLTMAAEFHRAPNRKSLAAILRAAADEAFLKTLIESGVGVSWPLLSLCLLADETMPPDKLAELADAGVFGDLEDWRAAETRWAEHGAAMEDLQRFADPSDDLADIATIGIAHVFSASLEHLTTAREAWVSDLLAILQAASGRTKSQLAWLVEFALTRYMPLQDLSPEDLELIIKASTTLWLTASIVQLVSPSAMGSEKLADVLADLAIAGRVRSGDDGGSDFDYAVPLIYAVAARPGLIPFLLNLLRGDVKRFPQIVVAAQQAKNSSEPHVAAAANVVLLLATQGTQGDIASIIDEAKPRYGLFHLLDALAGDALPEVKGIKVATQVLEAVKRGTYPEFDRVMAAVSKLADSRRSGLADGDCATRLGIDPGVCAAFGEVATSDSSAVRST